MIAFAKQRTICVVDSAREDYESLIAAAPREGATVAFFDNAGEALRVAPRVKPELWIVNIELPDMSGLELQEMLRARCPGVPVCLVGDTYAPEEEIRARISGATMYFCKPIEGQWLLGTPTGAATGAGP